MEDKSPICKHIFYLPKFPRNKSLFGIKIILLLKANLTKITIYSYIGVYMKKFIGLLFTALFAASLAFADDVINVNTDIIDSDWIAGKWILNLTMASNDESESESSQIEIYGNEEDSLVYITSDEEYCSLEDFVELLSQCTQDVEVDDETLAGLMFLGITFKGDFDFHLNKKGPELSYYFYMGMDGDYISISINMKKTGSINKSEYKNWTDEYGSSAADDDSDDDSYSDDSYSDDSYSDDSDYDDYDNDYDYDFGYEDEDEEDYDYNFDSWYEY